MQHILVYADSLSWGIIPGTRQRLAFEQRWPGVMELSLNKNHKNVRVIENCLNGRRTVWDDPFKSGRNGLDGLAESIEMHSPLELVILMLGTNDFQSMHPHNAWHASQGLQTLITAIRNAPIEPGMPAPPILVVSPPPISSPKGPIAPKFLGGESKCIGLNTEYKKVCQTQNCFFFDASTLVSSSEIDGVHLDPDQHIILGNAISNLVNTLLKENTQI